MQVTETLSEGLRRSYAVTVPAADIERATRNKLAEIGRSLRLPGFRPGKVPANLVRQRYGNQVMAEILQDAVSSAADRVVEDGNLRPASQPRISLAREPVIGGPPQDLQINVELEVLPDIALPDLSAISLTRLRAEPSDETIAQALERIATQNRGLAPIEEDRGAAEGDVLVIDFTGAIDGVPFQGGKGGDVSVELGGQGFIPGFAEQLEGLRPGQTRTIEVTFPSDYQAAHLAGKTASFEIEAKALNKPIIPAQDDSLASKIGFDDFAALRDAVRGQMQAEYDQMGRLRIKRELLDALAEQADFESPAGLLQIEFDAIWKRVEAERERGAEDEEDRGKDEETLRAEYRAIADRRVRLGLMLSEIGRVNAIEVTPAEISTALRHEASRYPGQEKQVIEFFRKNQGAIEQLRGPIFEDKVVDYILSVAQVEERTVQPEELSLPGIENALPAHAGVQGSLDAALEHDEAAALGAPAVFEEAGLEEAGLEQTGQAGPEEA
jgi:trigger factor